MGLYLPAASSAEFGFVEIAGEASTPGASIVSNPDFALSDREFPLVVRYFYEGPAMHEAGDTFEFRLLDSRGDPVAAASNPVVTLAVPEGHLGFLVSDFNDQGIE
jgi:hypothetical protein